MTDCPKGFTRVGAVGDFPVGLHEISVSGEKRVLYHVSADVDGVDPACPFYASQPNCLHRPCDLSDVGELAGGVVTCTPGRVPGCGHGSDWDVVDGGKRLNNGPAPEQALVMFETRCLDGDVCVARDAAEP